jgi:GAF domain-containing protein
MSTDQDAPVSRLDFAVAELTKINAGQQPLNDVLARTVQLAKTILRVPIEASVTLIDSEEPTTPAFTGRVAMDLDETQYQLGYGPCLAAAEAGQLVSIPDMATEERWPEFTADARRSGVHSSLSVPLPVQRQVIGALNLYSSEGQSFDDDVVALAEKFGDYAAVAIAHTTLYLSTSQLAEQMSHAMQSRAAIEQAKGILMGQRRCDADAAFNILVGLSQHSHRKLRDVALILIDHTLASGPPSTAVPC